MSLPMHLRGVLFDLDGTLVNSLPGIEYSVDCALAECGKPPRACELRPLIGPPIREILGKLLEEPPEEEDLSLVEQAFRASYDSTGWLKTVPVDGAVETLRELHNAGLPLFVVTNKPSAPTLRILEHLGISGLFSEILCRNSRTPAFLSKAEMLQHVIDLHQLEMGECLYVGDTGEDYRASREVGLTVAIVPDGYGEAPTEQPGCIYLRNVSELLTIVEGMEKS